MDPALGVPPVALEPLALGAGYTSLPPGTEAKCIVAADARAVTVEFSAALTQLSDFYAFRLAVTNPSTALPDAENQWSIALPRQASRQLLGPAVNAFRAVVLQPETRALESTGSVTFTIDPQVLLPPGGGVLIEPPLGVEFVAAVRFKPSFRRAGNGRCSNALFVGDLTLMGLAVAAKRQL